MSSAFTKLALATGAALLLAVPAQAAVLHDQSGDLGFYNNPSDDYQTPQDSLDNQLADDFTVPPGQRWTITGVDVVGDGSSSLPWVVNTRIYGSSGTLPGTQLFEQLGFPAANFPNYSVPLTGTPALKGPGTYWISVQQTGAFYASLTWGWQTRTVQDGNPAAFRNPGGGYVSGSCLDWTPMKTCFPSADVDLAWKISGEADSEAVTFGKLKRLRSGAAKLTVNLPGPGILTVGGKGVRGASDLVGMATSVTVKIKTTGKTRKLLKANGRVNVRPYFGYSAPGADPSETFKKIKLTKRL